MPVTDTRPGKESLTFRAYETKTLQQASGILAGIAHLDPEIGVAMTIIDRITAGGLGPTGFKRPVRDRPSILDQTPPLIDGGPEKPVSTVREAHALMGEMKKSGN